MLKTQINMKNIYGLFVIALAILISTSCKKEDDNGTEIDEPYTEAFRDGEVSDDLKINQLQYLGSHNSYRKRTTAEVLSFLGELASLSPNLDLGDLDYDHVDLEEQFTLYGVRQIELDFYADFEGGRFYNRRGSELAGLNPVSGIPALLQPGNKVLHIADIDYETHYYTLIEALQAVKDWSVKNPTHLPIFILMETKTQTVADQVSGLGFVEAEPWDKQRIDVIEEEILSVFSKDDIIKPDDVRGSYATLNEAVLTNGWPTVGASRGKVMFLLDQSNINTIYRDGNLSLEGKLMFTSSRPGDPDGAFVKRNGGTESDIRSLVEQGYLVRSLIGGTTQARTGDYSKFNSASSNGVHFLSTDYYRPDPRYKTSSEWTNFNIRFATKSFKINPVTGSK